MPKFGSVLGATRTSQSDATSAGRGRGRGRGTSGMKPSTTRRGGTAARGRGRGQPSESASAKAGNGQGTGTFGSSASSDSPFAQIKNHNAFSSANGSSAGLMFGKPSPAPGSTALTGFGAPSVIPNATANDVDHAKDSRSSASKRAAHNKPTTAPRNSGGGKPMDYQERYDKLKNERNKQREKSAKSDAADPNQTQNKTPVGTCTAMCPEFERVERIVQKMVDKCEKSIDPETGALETCELKMVKRFRRSAAGYDEQLPSDIRTPSTLLQTMNYLIRHVLSGPEPLGQIHKFVWDRTRSIRNDFSVQQLTKIEDVKIATKCLERIARFHIVSLHLLSSPDNEEQFDHHQEREQLNNTMLSLMHYYDDNRDRIEFPNEAEFRAYYIVLAIHDQRHDIEDRVQRWPQEILKHPRVQVALDLLAASGNTWDYQRVLDDFRPNVIAQGFYERFFSLVDSPAVSYLMGCVAEIYFSNVRQTAIRSIWKACCRVPISQQHKNEDWTLDELTRTLYFDDDSQTEEFLEEQGLQLMEREDGVPYLNWGSSSIDTVEFTPSSRQVFSKYYVESKRGGRTLAAIILGLNVRQAASRGMIDPSLVELPASPIEVEEDNELFVKQNEPIETESSTTPTQIEEPTSSLFPPPAPSEKPEIPLPKPTFSIFQTPNNPFTSNTPASSSNEVPKTTSQPSFSFGNSTLASEPSTTSTSVAQSGPLFSWPKPESSPSSVPPAPVTSVELPKQRPSWLPAVPNSTASQSSPSTPTIQESKPLFGLAPSSFTFTGQPKPDKASTTATPAETSNPLSIGQSASTGSSTMPVPSVNPFSSIAAEPLNMASSRPSTPSSPFNMPASSANPFSSIVSEPLNTSKLESATPQNPQPLFPVQSSISSYQPTVQDTSLLSSIPPAPDSMESVSRVEELGVPPNGSSIEEHEPAADNSSEPEVSAEENQELRTSWMDTLRRAAMSQRDIMFNRKRPLETEHKEPEAQEPEALSLQAQDVPKPAPARQKSKKTSLALASIAPLPTLPILEEVKKLTQPRKKDDEVESTRASQIDEDEMLLSAARIAAEELKNGPKLLESTPDYSYFEPLRSSTYLGRSTSSARSSLSSSSSPHARINGYEVALAPETPLGLGRTLSRSEQRLRLTGGKGLAYKPLPFPSNKETDMDKKAKRKKVRIES